MRVIPGVVTLGNVQGGTLSSGTIPFPRMYRLLQDGTSGVDPNAAGVTLVTVDLGTVTVGDIILVIGHTGGTKGGVAGDVAISITKDSGTATFDQWGGSVRVNNAPAGATVQMDCVTALEVTGSGTLVLKLSGQSVGSDLTVLAGNHLWAAVLVGQ